MSSTGEDGTDRASIKPVSSLRSLFEKQMSSDAGARTNSGLLAPKSLARVDHTQDGSHTLTRNSLDIPRTSSPWSTVEAVSDPQRKGTKGPPVPSPRRPNSRILPRPLSTTSLSIPRSPPVVRVDAPTSPPKVSQSPSIQHTLQIFASIPSSPVNVGSKSPSQSPVPFRRLNRNPATEPQLAAAQFKATVPAARPLCNPVNETYAHTPAKGVPPPVNRADKPKVPSKPNLIPSKTNLEPSKSTADERISPFSTPPSSDESVGAETLGPSRRSEAKAIQNVARSPMEREMPRPGKSRLTYDSPLIGEKAVPPRKPRPDARSLGFVHALEVPNAVPETPPGLPPRSGLSQRPPQTMEAKDVDKGKPMATVIPLPDRSKKLQSSSESAPEFLPPPKRASVAIPQRMPNRQSASVPYPIEISTDSNLMAVGGSMGEQEPDLSSYSSQAADYPDASSTNRRPPFIKTGAEEIGTIHDTRLVDVCGQYVATTGHVTRVWDVYSGELVASFGTGEKEIRVTSLAFKPGATVNNEGSDLWLGNNYGDIQEVNIPTQSIVFEKSGAHERREIVKIHRYQSSMLTLDDGGKLCVWPGDDAGLPSLQYHPVPHRIPRGHSFSLFVQENLWLATGKDVRIYRFRPADGAISSILQEPLNQPNVGVVTSGCTIGSQLDRVYFGHADGKVTIYSTTDFTCLGVVSVSSYKISCLAGAGSHLWAGYSTGMVYAYDTRVRPWLIKKDWLAHESPVLNILVDRSSLWKAGVLRVVSLGADHALRFWDGTLETDWLENDMHDRDIEYCSFRELSALVITWNAGAVTPIHLRDSQFFQDVLRADKSPDLLVFGFQELVDLEDKKLTAKTLFKGSKRKDPSEQEHMSRQYRAWRDYLVRCIEDTMPSNEPYHLLHTASMVGLFSCVFIRVSHRTQVRSLNAIEIKRGMGGRHGNKGALILRFVLDDSSICLVNCHLAAGQTQTVNRNNDITAILESSLLPSDHHASKMSDTFVGGGDGTMILDHEICILNGDLNYRIDTMGRDTVVKAIQANNLSKLLERDQLLVSRRRNPGFRVRSFIECPITFAPTYKYDVGTDRYDTSEKRRAPAWCDRILYRGPGKIKQIDYRRHELRVSDHRPVSGRFRIRIKAVDAGKRAIVWKESEARFAKARESLAREAKVQYLRDVLGVPPNEAKRLI